jgi:hypothetical protein
MIVLAHAAHWLVQVAYVAPLVLLGVAMGVGKLRERRRLRAGDDSRPTSDN